MNTQQLAGTDVKLVERFYDIAGGSVGSVEMTFVQNGVWMHIVNFSGHKAVVENTQVKGLDGKFLHIKGD